MVIFTQRRIYLFCRFPGGNVSSAQNVFVLQVSSGDINSAGSVLAVVLVLQISWW